MNKYFGRGRGHRWPRLRMACVVVGMAATMLVAACGSSQSSRGSGGSPSAGAANSSSAVVYSQCVRSHGIPDFPDPGSNGDIPKETGQQLGVSDSMLRAATGACANLNPNQPPSAAQQRQELADDVRFAQCMRSHGLPNLPDPTTGPDGPYFAISISQVGFDPHSPQIIAKARACQHVLPAGTGLPRVTVSS